jgi:Tfp pilus assembly protein PilN
MNEAVIQQQINLLVTRFQKVENFFSAKRIMGVWFGLIALLALYTGYSCYESISLGMKSAVVLTEKQQVIEELGNLKKITPKVINHSLETDVENLKKAKERKLQVKKLLSSTKMDNIKGFSGYMEGLSNEIIPNVWLTSINISDGGRNFGLQGSTLDPRLVPRFIQRLSSEQSFAGSEFKIFAIKDPEGEIDKKDRQPKTSVPHYVDFVIQTSISKEEKTTE